MASWMVHLRVAQALYERIEGLSELEFIVGNIAPDSGVPSEDWSSFTPPYDVSHFVVTDENDERHKDLDSYISRYFTKELQSSYTKEQYSFYLGYLVHLITDTLWGEHVIEACAERFPEEYANDKRAAVWRWKRDFYDLDAKYIRDNPDFRAFNVYAGAVGFKNTFLDFFAPDAFDNRREYITSFYLSRHDGLDREYECFTEREMSEFVSFAKEEIPRLLEGVLSDVNKL